MKIAIFGDSWGDASPPFTLHSDEESWPLILSNTYDITNFSESGSSVYFSAEKFLANYENFDKIIFFITDCARRYLPEHSSITFDYGSTRHIKANTPEIIKDFLAGSPRNQEIAKAIDLYYSYIVNDAQDIYYHDLTLDHIQSKLSSDRLLMLEYPIEIAFKENRYYQSLGHDLTLFSEWKNCHMTHTNNRRMAELIDQWLTNPESTKLTIGNTRRINSELFHDPVNEPFEKYYKRID